MIVPVLTQVYQLVSQTFYIPPTLAIAIRPYSRIVSKVRNRNPEKGERPESGGKFMQQLIELYEMAALNGDTLRETERQTILQAGLALGMFQRAMHSFKVEFSQTPAAPDTPNGSARLPGDQCFSSSVM